MGREAAAAFHPRCVIYKIADTTTPKYAPAGVSRERKAMQQRQGKNNYNRDDGKQLFFYLLFIYLLDRHSPRLSLYVTCSQPGETRGSSQLSR